MSDNENNNVDKNKVQPSKIIDVTKPKTSTSSFNSTNVSSHTLREQQALEKLRRQVGGSTSSGGSKGSLFKTIIAIVLIVVLIALAIIFVVIIGGDKQTQEEVYDVRVSMQIENESSLKIVTDTGHEKFKDIDPGDIVPVSAYVRNSNNYQGDNSAEVGESKSIYVRFKFQFTLNYQVANEKIKPTISDKWYKFNAENEVKFGDQGIKEDDGYYYYIGTLSFMQRAELFSEIEFVGEQIFWEDGGHYGQIQVTVESMEANIDYIEGENRWPTAPRYWIQLMRSK